MLRRLLRAVGFLAAILVAGTVGYTLIEGWHPFDSLYMTVITVATVGFREIRPLSDAGRVLTMGLILMGVGALGYSFGTIVEFMVEGHLRTILEGRRMQKRISELSDHYIVVGIGRVGSVVARSLADEGVPFVVVDSCEECRAAAEEAGWLFVHGDAMSEEILLQAGVKRGKGLVAAVDTDADNLFVVLTARMLNPDLFIVARSTSIASERKILSSGADRVITPNVIGGRRMAAMLMRPAVADYLDVVMHGDGLEYRLDALRVTASPRSPARRSLRRRYATRPACSCSPYAPETLSTRTPVPRRGSLREMS
ncbi:kef-type K+ transport systems, predicted NAD-binding component [Coriobacteriaceae bacterium EMTCatB1]|nr:kef-type K+ transport systems, predicted NAD-binding component [Coriobacteriaceae bacterium EMTCatB1]